MPLSGCLTGCRAGGAGLVGLVVAEHGPQDVDAAAGQGQDGLGVLFALGSLAVIEGPGLLAASDADQGGCVEDPAEQAVVAFQPVQVAGAAPEVAGGGGQAGVASQVPGV